MTRSIQRGPEPDKESFFSKLAKYIPAEMTALFLFSSGVIEGMKLNNLTYWLFFLFVVFLSPIYLIFIATTQDKKPWDKAQVIISPFAVIVWVYALGGPFKATLGDAYNEGYALLLLAAFTTLIPLADALITYYATDLKQKFPKLNGFFEQKPLKQEPTARTETQTIQNSA